MVVRVEACMSACEAQQVIYYMEETMGARRTSHSSRQMAAITAAGSQRRLQLGSMNGDGEVIVKVQAAAFNPM